MTLISVFIFTKPNRMGVSKTRLAREIGTSEARRLNALTTRAVLRAAQDPRWQTALMVAPDQAIAAREPLWPSHLPRFGQGQGNLGDRMSRAFALAPQGKVVFLGTDMPDLSPDMIWRAVRALNTHETVFGPADDGGFWLYGQRKRIGSSAPFQNVRWSSEYALADVIANLDGRPPSFLPVKIDLDDAASVRKWRLQSRLNAF